MGGIGGARRLGGVRSMVVVGAVLATVLTAVLAAAALAGCASGGAAPTDPLTGTTWAGVDSLDRETIFLFQPDGTVRVTYYDDTFDDELDVWRLSGTSLEIDVYQGDAAGTATYVGRLGESSLALSATTDGSDESYTVNLSRQQ